jgi:hypothetical protein
MSNNLMNTINARKGLFRLNGANDDQIDDAEKTLGLNFSEEYQAYLKEFGCISFDSHEFMGLNTSGRLDVVLITLFERESRRHLIPLEMYVVEIINDGDMLILQNTNGEIFELLSNGDCNKIFDSFCAYLRTL